jgi:hypothetical protein
MSNTCLADEDRKEDAKSSTDGVRKGLVLIMIFLSFILDWMLYTMASKNSSLIISVLMFCIMYLIRTKQIGNNNSIKVYDITMCATIN